MVNLHTTYMGIPLKNPIIAGASSLSSSMKLIKRMEAAGAGAIVIKSLFEEEVQLDTFKFDQELEAFDHIHAEMTTIFPEIQHGGPREHLYWVKKVKEAVNIPVIASLNAVNLHTWLEYARALEQTGVDGLELNFYSLPIHADVTGKTIEAQQLEVLEGVKKAVKVPVSVKLSPYYTSLTHFVHQLDQSGADGLILFNRLFQPEIDIEEEKEKTYFDLSESKDNLLSLRWTGILSGQLQADILSNTGIMTSVDIIKMILAGAAGVQLVSTLFKNRMEYIPTLLKEIESWMEKKGYETLDDFRGKLTKKNIVDPWAYERSQYIQMLLTGRPLEGPKL